MRFGIGDVLSVIAPNSMISKNFFPPRSKFNLDTDIPDLSGKIIMVTGGNAGLGYEMCKVLLCHGAKVWMASRSKERAEQAIEKLKIATGKDAVFFHHLDLNDLVSVKKSALEFLEKDERIDVLINNAGISCCSLDQVTAQNIDAQFGTNTVAPYLFTTTILPALQKSTATQGTNARVVQVSSCVDEWLAPDTPSGIEWRSLLGGPERDAALKTLGNTLWTGFALYGQSKLGIILMSNVLNKMYSDIDVCYVHPGYVATNIVGGHGKVLNRFEQWAFGLFSYPASYGPITPLYAAAVANNVRGVYFNAWDRVRPEPPKAMNEETQANLKKWMESRFEEASVV